MRGSQEDKEKSHVRIIRGAARMLRERGLEKTNLADVMKKAGMTQGGFYRHFRSKEELVAEALRAAFTELRGLLKSEDATKAENYKTFRDRYLSMGHVENPALGCPMVSLGPDISRDSEKLKQVFTEGASAMVNEISELFGGLDVEKSEKAMQELALLVGAVVIGRATNSEFAEKVLDACRKVPGPAGS